jgi:hypothetical protein
VPNRPKGIPKIAERLGLTVAVAQLPIDGEAVLVTGNRLRMPALVKVDDTKPVQAGGLAVAVAKFPGDGEAVLVTGNRLRMPAQPLVGDPEVAPA